MQSNAKTITKKFLAVEPLPCCICPYHLKNVSNASSKDVRGREQCQVFFSRPKLPVFFHVHLHSYTHICTCRTTRKQGMCSSQPKICLVSNAPTIALAHLSMHTSVPAGQHRDEAKKQSKHKEREEVDLVVIKEGNKHLLP